MSHYEQQLRAKSDELSVQKREANKIREVMARATPTKTGPVESPAVVAAAATPSTAVDVQTLREELLKKTEVIKKLESMITPKKT